VQGDNSGSCIRAAKAAAVDRGQIVPAARSHYIPDEGLHDKAPSLIPMFSMFVFMSYFLSGFLNRITLSGSQSGPRQIAENDTIAGKQFTCSMRVLALC
jgi:hypothetical protein